jgi:hypothetical protein
MVEEQGAEEQVASLRGAEAAGSAGAVGVVLLWLLVIGLGIALALDAIGTVSDRARAERLHSHGVAVEAAIARCTGNLGGSGSNGAGYTCSASYVAAGHHYTELLGGQSSFLEPGHKVAAVADPDEPARIVLASALPSADVAASRIAVLVLLAAVWSALLVLAVRFSRRRRGP